jgi:hypothetical protein
VQALPYLSAPTNERIHQLQKEISSKQQAYEAIRRRIAEADSRKKTSVIAAWNLIVDVAKEAPEFVEVEQAYGRLRAVVEASLKTWLREARDAAVERRQSEYEHKVGDIMTILNKSSGEFVEYERELEMIRETEREE